MVEEYFDATPNGEVVLKAIVKDDATLRPLITKFANDKAALIKNLQFVYHYCNKNLYTGLNQDERVRSVLRAIGVPASWRISSVTKAVCNELIQLHKSPSERSLEVLRNVLLDFVETLDVLRESNKANLKKISVFNIEELTDEQAKVYKQLIATVESSFDSVLDYSIKLPKNIMALEDLEKRIKKEVTENKIAGAKTVASKYDD